jgi:hypothetical protein
VVAAAAVPRATALENGDGGAFVNAKLCAPHIGAPACVNSAGLTQYCDLGNRFLVSHPGLVACWTACHPSCTGVV